LVSITMIALTDFGDLAVLLPLAVVMLLWLLAMRSLSEAAWWLAAVALCTGGTALLKIYFFACPIDREVISPSGHTSFSTLVYGALAVVIAAELKVGWQRIAIIGGGTAFVVAIAVSRFVLRAHSPPEVVFGMVVGLASLALFGEHYLRRRPAEVPLKPLLVAVVVLMAAFHGRELHAEPLLHAISWYFHIASIACA